MAGAGRKFGLQGVAGGRGQLFNFLRINPHLRRRSDRPARR